jgi:hypothetical protein
MRLSLSCPPLHRAGILVALAVLGCGHDEKLTPVCGRVLWQGQPLPGGTIVFTPDVERGGHGTVACGEIGADGRYSLRTEDQFGVAPGWYRVTIAAAIPIPAPNQSAGLPIELPRRYTDPEQSGLLREVQPGKSCEHDFYLEEKE